jgi:Zn ribbon nucleic-acid-binding protein
MSKSTNDITVMSNGTVTRKQKVIGYICESCNEIFTYKMRYNESLDSYICNTCWFNWEQKQMEEYAKARFEQEHDL